MRFKALILIFLASLTFCGCTKDNNKIDKNAQKLIILNENKEQSASIKTELAKTRDINLEITIPAQFKAQNQSLDRIYSPLEGKITKVFVEPGKVVHAGEPLAQIKSDEISQIQLEFLERIMELDANVKQMQAQLEVSSQNYKREAILVKEKISSRAEFELANSMAKKDAAALSSLRTQRNALIKVYSQRMAVYGAPAGSINKVLATKNVYPYITVCSNKTGVVLERKINSGEFVEKNKELFSVANLATVWLVGYAFEKDAPHLKVGEKVFGVLEEGKDEKIKGELSYVSPILDTETKTLEVRADIQNPDFKIKPNMYAEMLVEIGAVKRLAVPNDAIEQYGDYYFVYVKVKPFTYQERKVEIGKKNETHTEIISGIKEGEEIVVQGAFSLLGESIKIEEEN